MHIKHIRRSLRFSSAMISAIAVAICWPTVSLGADGAHDDSSGHEAHDDQGHGPIDMSPQAAEVPFDPSAFRSDPDYADKPYDPQAQIDIYGGKHMNPTARPLFEWGRELFQYGAFRPAPTLLGETNPMYPQVLIYGDYRTAVAYNDKGLAEQATWAHRLNLEVDARLTGTERVHAFFRPLDKDGKFTRLDFGGENHEFEDEIDGNVDALFFEGDLGSLLAGFSGTQSRLDIPVAAGLIPLLFQNGVWVEDAFTGFAFTIPARNSRSLDISNMDVTFFFGFDRVTTGAVPGIDAARIFGVTAFIESMQGYWELGYGYTDDKQGLDRNYHNMTAAFTRRYFHRISNSIRVIANVGQDPDTGVVQTADGVIFLIENSLITSLPSTLVPYVNLFFGFDRPQSLARDGGAGGILKNTGINFESDGLTGFPTLDATGADTYGLAAGIEYLFNLDQQLVVEFATVQVRGDVADRFAPGAQYAFGVRYQRPINNRMILRVDGMWGWLEDLEEIQGIRFEFRWKF